VTFYFAITVKPLLINIFWAFFFEKNIDIWEVLVYNDFIVECGIALGALLNKKK